MNNLIYLHLPKHSGNPPDSTRPDAKVIQLSARRLIENYRNDPYSKHYADLITSIDNEIEKYVSQVDTFDWII